MKAYLFLFLALLLTASPLFSKEDVSKLLTLSAKVNKATLTSDEELLFTVTITAQKGLKYQTAPWNPQDLSLLDYSDKPVREEDGKEIHEKTYKLKAELSGSYVLPEFHAVYLDKGKEEYVKTGELFVEVVAPKNPTDPKEQGIDQQMADIKPMRKRPFVWMWWHFVALATLFALGTAFYLYYKKRSHRKEVLSLLSPWEKAFLDIETLKKLMDEKELKELHFSLSEIVRNYLEEQFLVKASDMTYEEIRRQLFEEVGPTDSQKKMVLLVLEQCDWVKFTDSSSSREMFEQLVEKAISFVEETKPKTIVTAQEESVL